MQHPMGLPLVRRLLQLFTAAVYVWAYSLHPSVRFHPQPTLW